MRRNGAARQVHGLQRGAALKKKEYAALPDVIGVKARVLCQAREPQHAVIEPCGTVEIVNVEAGLDDALEVGRHISPHLKDSACLFGHAARFPRRLPDDFYLRLANAADAADRRFDHARQFLR